MERESGTIWPKSHPLIESMGQLRPGEKHVVTTINGYSVGSVLSRDTYTVRRGQWCQYLKGAGMFLPGRPVIITEYRSADGESAKAIEVVRSLTTRPTPRTERSWVNDDLARLIDKVEVETGALWADGTYTPLPSIVSVTPISDYNHRVDINKVSWNGEGFDVELKAQYSIRPSGEIIAKPPEGR